ncbi:ATP-dependent RNA helicase DbpA [Thermomonas sp.]|uniref:ATP-dependent RNA helicase DbpA n=1 Tax=Thermomonas sp. TaxID=1971895 RepID=UPI00238B2884|nr:ATP-dependent RNA helicase DbpA [Thermomonas sp.]MBS0458680.1 ATP-dependent RNA helicase DbpA [Pseudomonadota bacterium]MDE2382088.1 ATP-dependent RNA helicase DbpA [Xanthomonadaceae bacterium]HOC10118.1 ATP-dependent RNA helicase DbpA [Thermomonas sp.]HQA01830.1 ATP-dependent RNA helicase DbpA [Thermomonas sp.]HQE07726.1 ATP-dependent RNA helicase DbpA [Thermomonas sp.]
MTFPTAFAELALDPTLRAGLDALEYTTLTAIQAQALPAILQGRDLIAQAPTGSGKTAAFGLGLLHAIDAGSLRTQALVLCPTRELADQVGKQLRKLATGIANLKLSVLCGGIPLAPQLASLAHAPHVVVGTPGRVLELVQKDALDLRGVRTLVLDEADRMLDMGFEEPIRALVKRTPKERQSLLFSATFPDSIRSLATAMLREPLEVSVDGGAQPATIAAHFFDAEPARRAPQLAALLLEFRPDSAVVFCNMRRDTEEVVGSLAHYGFTALALHGDMEQREREEVLVRFANRSCTVLVASDVAARGLDIDDIGAVINYELPTDADTYLHRVGRTGRAGRKGLALSLVAASERNRASLIEERQGQPIRFERIDALAGKPSGVPQAAMATLRIDAGRTDKLRPGDIVGALTGDAGLHKDSIGKIDVFATRSYVAIARNHARHALAQLRAGKIKGRKFRVSLL